MATVKRAAQKALGKAKAKVLKKGNVLKKKASAAVTRVKAKAKRQTKTLITRAKVAETSVAQDFGAVANQIGKLTKTVVKAGRNTLTREVKNLKSTTRDMVKTGRRKLRMA